MIRRPAERAGLELEDGLANEILKDGGGNPGEALPLVAFCLDELYRQAAPPHYLALDAYRSSDGLRGAIGRRVDALLEAFRQDKAVDLEAAMPQVFRALVHVDATGKVTRQRASRDELMAASHPIPELVATLINPGRLLLAEGTDGRAVVMLAHEALIQEWPALSHWLDVNSGQLQIRSLIDSIDSTKSVLILGRFTPERRPILEALRQELHRRNYVPVLFDFAVPPGRVTDTLSLLARMARFVIADLTDPSSIPHELALLVPSTVVPVQPILLRGQSEYALFEGLRRRYFWVLKPYGYTNSEQLMATLAERVIGPAEAKARELFELSAAG